jgi:hypothetical protein
VGGKKVRVSTDESATNITISSRSWLHCSTFHTKPPKH